MQLASASQHALLTHCDEHRLMHWLVSVEYVQVVSELQAPCVVYAQALMQVPVWSRHTHVASVAHSAAVEKRYGHCSMQRLLAHWHMAFDVQSPMLVDAVQRRPHLVRRLSHSQEGLPLQLVSSLYDVTHCVTQPRVDEYSHMAVALQVAAAVVGFWYATRPHDVVQRPVPAFHMQLLSLLQDCMLLYADTHAFTH